MNKSNFEKLDVYKLSGKLSDVIWNIVMKWNHFSRSTIGSQIVRSADSVGAIIAEGLGRGTCKDNKRFVRMARGSLNETIYWLSRAHERKLIKDELFFSIKSITNELSPRLNAYLNSIGKNS